VGELVVRRTLVDDTEAHPEAVQDRGTAGADFQCDRCGFPMIERGCKLICPNCGNRFDCSDLSVYMD
jgi:uncharacterized Zn finger protein (UPF0148 family)